MNFRRSAVVVALLLACIGGAVVAATPNTYGLNWFYVYGNQNRFYGAIGADGEGFAHYAYHGPTYIQVRVDGKNGGWCRNGSPNGFGCGGSAVPDVFAWHSQATIQYGDIPYGCYTGTVMFYVSGVLMINYPTGACWDMPPSEPGDGYCTSYDFDPGQGQYMCNMSPIIIDTGTDKDRYKLDPQVRVAFDLDADGYADTVGWTKRNSDIAFLALDRNGNGTIDNGSELFGGKTVAGANNGFAALRVLANNIEFGWLDANHGGELFSRLLLWHDRNQDGVSQADELSPASSVLEAIGLGYTLTTDADKAGNLFTFKGWARKYDPKAKTEGDRALSAPTREFDVYDVNFAFQQ